MVSTRATVPVWGIAVCASLVFAACVPSATSPGGVGPTPRPGLAPATAAAVRAAEEKLFEGEDLFLRGDWTVAAERYEEGLATLEKTLSPTDAIVDSARHNLVVAHTASGNYERAESLARQNLAARILMYGQSGRKTAASRLNLARVYGTIGRYEDAEALYVSALATYRAHRRDDPLSLAIALNLAGGLYVELGQLDRAETLLRESIDLLEHHPVPDTREHAQRLAEPVNNLAGILSLRGELPAAELEYERARDLLERAYSPGHPYVAIALGNLALNHLERRDYRPADQLLRRALKIQEAHFRGPHRDVAMTLTNLARLHVEQQRFGDAESLFSRAIETSEKALDAEHAEVASPLIGLGELYLETGRADAAREKLHRALNMLEKAYGQSHPQVAATLNRLGDVERRERRLEAAMDHYERSRELYEELLPRDHPQHADALSELAYTRWAKGDLEGARDAFQQGAERRERSMQLMLAAGSEAQKLRYSAAWEAETDAILTFHTQSAASDPLARDAALLTGLRRKGRVLEAISAQHTALLARVGEEERVLLAELDSVRAELGAIARRVRSADRKPGDVQRFEQLEADWQRLEGELSKRAPEFRASHSDVTLRDIRRALPDNGVLVEFFSYRLFDPVAPREAEERGERRYVVYLVFPDREPGFVDLGPAEGIDRKVGAALIALASPQQRVSASSRRRLRTKLDELRQVLMDPVLRQLDEQRHLILSPDGALHLLPFGALAIDGGQSLIERFTITYVSSARDMLRTGGSGRSRSGPLLVASPAFGAATPGVREWLQLPGTREEAEALRSLLPGAGLLTGGEASEAALKGLRGPSLLHVATHGFFEGGLDLAATGPGGRDRAVRGVENPLLRSGLVFASANVGQTETGDGILTALEASALDLAGTELVVLSACETGVGKVEDGEGVFGLRRALVMAGSATQVISLWQVADTTTRDLMVAFYRHLIEERQGRSEALRSAQLELIAGGHPPYDWAAFIPSGDWRPLGRGVTKGR